MRGYSYKLKLTKMIILLIVSIVSIGLIFFCELKDISLGSTFGGLIAGFVLPFLFTSFVDLTDNSSWKTSQRKLKRAGLLQKDTIVRISFAYLFRIKVRGKYFLVKNSRTKKYQPVGGAYKYYKEEEEDYFTEKIPVENDDRIAVDEITKKDYRLLVKNKDLRKFVRRFDKTENRENVSDLSREFIEEVFKTNFIDKSNFGDLSYKYCGRHTTNVAYSEVFMHYELLIADIIEVRLTEEQEQLFINLMENKNSSYCFATSSEIKSLGVMGNDSDTFVDSISNHTYKIISETTDLLTIRTRHKNVFKIELI